MAKKAKKEKEKEKEREREKDRSERSERPTGPRRGTTPT